MRSLAAVLMVGSLAGLASASVFNMGGTRDPATGQWTGLASLETVRVGDPGNAGDAHPQLDGTSGYGAVGYTYNIGKYEVTAGQYCEFLNAVAGVDTYSLYRGTMWSSPYGCQIERYAGSGTAGDPYRYRVAADYANRPVNWVSFGDACRFANWLQNGQPTGVQEITTTEDGAYDLSGTHSYYGPDGLILDPLGLDAALAAVRRKAGWKWAVTSEDEWYKAAYYNPATGNYYSYPTGSDTIATAMANYNGTVGHTTDVGQYVYSSPYGTFDQGGNVFEWNEAVQFGEYRGVRGGCYRDIDLYLGASYSDVGEPWVENAMVGFRVVEVPEPATLCMLALGGLLIARRRV